MTSMNRSAQYQDNALYQPGFDLKKDEVQTYIFAGRI